MKSFLISMINRLEDNKSTLFWGCVILVLLRVVLCFVMYYLPHMESFKNGGPFLSLVAGDDGAYYMIAKAIYVGDFSIRSGLTLGYPSFLVVLLAIFGTGDFFTIFFPVIIFNGIFLFSAAILLITYIAYFIFEKKILSLFCGLSFLLFPFIFYVFRTFGPLYPNGRTWGDYSFLYSNWLTMMPDHLSAFLVLLIFFLVIWDIKKQKSHYFYALLGFLTGYVMMVRIANITTAAAIGLFLLLSLKYKKLIWYTLFSLIGFLPQFWYNAVFYKSPISFGYKADYPVWVANGWANGPAFGVGHLVHLFQRAADYSLFIVSAFLIILVFLSVGIRYLKKNNWQIALVVSSWFVFPVLFYMLFTSGQTTFRYYLPAVPPFVVLIAASIGGLRGVFLDKINQNRL